MEHFIAYHSVKRMGHEIEAGGGIAFLSQKLGHLKKAIGNTVWVVEGVPSGRKTEYRLRGAYVAEDVEVDVGPSNLHRVSGPAIKEFSPTVSIGGLDWFPALYKSQDNFSFGFNRLNDGTVVKALSALLQAEDVHPKDEFLDVDLLFAGAEGAARLAIHLRRERNHALVEAKKAAVLKATGRLCCEACGFEFSVVYGDLGRDFCEVHHLTPLSAASDSIVTTLDDLAVVCSNCHRIIHRSNPMPSIQELSALVSRQGL